MSNKKLITIACILVVTIFAGCASGLGIGHVIFSSPEYTLSQIKKSIEENGIEGIDPYLTGDAKKLWDSVDELSENTIISSLFAFLDMKDYISIIKSEITEIQWSPQDMMKGSDKATFTLGFNYKDKLVGTTDVTLSKIDGKWYVSNFTFPDFSKIDF